MFFFLVFFFFVVLFRSSCYLYIDSSLFIWKKRYFLKFLILFISFTFKKLYSFHFLLLLGQYFTIYTFLFFYSCWGSQSSVDPQNHCVCLLGTPGMLGPDSSLLRPSFRVMFAGRNQEQWSNISHRVKNKLDSI